MSLHVHTERSQSGEENDGLEARLLPLVVLGLRCPAQESNDVLGHLRRRSRRAYIRQKRGKCSFMLLDRGEILRTVFVFNEAVEENACHRDGVAREVRVVVHAVTNLEAGRRVRVASKESEDVVLRTTSRQETDSLRHELCRHTAPA